MDIDKRDRTELKAYFVKNAIPTESNFAELIDGVLSQKDDGIVKPPGDPLSIQASGDAASQKKAINFYESFADSNPAWVLSLNPRSDPSDPATARAGFNISDGAGNSRLFIDRTTGNLQVVSLGFEASGDATVNEISTDVALSDNSNSAVPTERAVKEYVDSLLVASIAAFATPTPPTGWLECNGQAVSRADYARLFGIIDTRFGAGNGNDTFNLPDLRGEFIRGWDSGLGVDPDREFGNPQQDQLQSHKHNDSGHAHLDSGHIHSSPATSFHTRIVIGRWENYVFNVPVVNYNYPQFYSYSWNQPGGVGEMGYTTLNRAIEAGHASIEVGKSKLGDPADSGSGAGEARHGNETRPRNVALMYCIKY